MVARSEWDGKYPPSLLPVGLKSLQAPHFSEEELRE
jgi:hypothetical protein